MSGLGGPQLGKKHLIRLLDRPLADLDADPGGQADGAEAAGVAPTVAAAHLGDHLTVAWCAFKRSGPAMWLSGPAGAPPGATCRSANAANLQSQLDGLAWVNVNLALHDQRDNTRVRPTPPLEEVLLGQMANGPAAWAIDARPVAVSETEQWSNWTRIAGRGEKGTVAEQVEAERARRLIGLLEAEAAQGLWTAQLWCGGGSVKEAKRLLGLLLASAGVAQLDVSISIDGAGIPFVTSPVVAAFARPPISELPGIRIRRTAEWDMTPESSGPIPVGRVLSPADQPVSELSVSLSTINRHTFVAGATGSGKSETVRRLLQQISAQGIPWMVIEPAKAEYQIMADLIHPKEVVMLKLGDVTRTPFSLNPLEPSVSRHDGPPKRFPLGTHLSLIRSLFEAAFQPDEPFPQILASGLERTFAQHGWDVATGRPLPGAVAKKLSYPTLSDLRRNALDVVADLGYGREVSDNVRGFIDVRISSLRSGIAGQFFESGHPLDLEDLADRNVVLQLEDLGNEQDQAFFIGAVLIRWSELLRLLGDSGGQLRHVLVLEEAHRLLRDNQDGPHSVEQFANLLAEIRSYGEGVIVAEQIPSKIIADVVKNSALKVVHRLPAEEDRQKVGATMNLDESQSRGIVSLGVGQAAVHADGMDRPLRVSIPPPPAVSTKPNQTADPRHRLHTRLCAKQNAEQACSIEEIEVGRRLAVDPLFSTWVDLAVLSRLVGKEMPMLAAQQRSRFRIVAGKSRRRLVCAVGLAVHTSVAGRSPDIIRYYEPSSLQDLVGGEILDHLLDGRPVGKAGAEWQAGIYRWDDIASRLRKGAETLATDDLKAIVDEAGHRGLNLVAKTPERALGSLISIQQASSQPYRDLVYGKPSVINDALRNRGSDDLAVLFDQLGATNKWIRKCFRIVDEPSPGSPPTDIASPAPDGD